MTRIIKFVSILALTFLLLGVVSVAETIPVGWQKVGDETVNSSILEDIDSETGTITTGDSGFAGVNEILPEVTIDDASEWANKKGYEIIHFLQVIVQPISIIAFIIGALMTLFGAMGNGSLSAQGLWVMAISVIIYAAILCAPTILQIFVSWATS